MSDNRAKIVCTLGPSSSSFETLKEMILAGMNVARLNFSHGTQEDHKRTVETLRRASEETGRVVGIMLDLQGPKVRVERFAEGSAELKTGAAFTITMEDVPGNAERVGTTYKDLNKDVQAGDTILLDDGMIVLEVTDVAGAEIHTKVLNGGVLKNNKGINVPGASLSVATITEKDYSDVTFGLTLGVDFLAMSFVRHPDDLRLMRSFLAKHEANLPIISKIEKPQALDHIDEIIAESDGVMVARGDLGVEIPAEDVPAIQKSIIAKCNQAGKPVITATQMLESMIHNPRPTRAEASDVANAILDGTDAVMLSGESATGKYPVETVATMKRIIHAIEGSPQWHARRPRLDVLAPDRSIQQGIAASACTLGESVGAKAIVCMTLMGSMARVLSRHRPVTPIIAISQNDFALRQLAMYWGVEGIHMADITTEFDDAVEHVESVLRDRNLVQSGDRSVFTAGLPFHTRHVTNCLRVKETR